VGDDVVVGWVELERRRRVRGEAKPEGLHLGRIYGWLCIQTGAPGWYK
jgi:hypothetical protein